MTEEGSNRMSQLYQPGTTIAGHYTVTGVLGSGGMADVYRARDTEMNRTVAIKVYGAESPIGMQRSFMTEARAAAVLSHPNIVTVYDVLDLAGEKYVIMEYVCGITLRDYLSYHGHLSVKECVNCAHQVLRALHAAHSRGIVHRDIKPGNILITTEGRIKITDFGIARLPDRDSFLLPDRTVGTVHYISPEQAGGGSVDERSDLYSLGIVMYEMLTGRRPFEAKNPADVAMMQVSTRPEPPSYRNPAVPSALEKIVLCALEKDPAARFDSAAEMLRMLNRLSDDLLTGRARPLREEGSAYRMAMERPDDRTKPLPRVLRPTVPPVVPPPPVEQSAAVPVPPPPADAVREEPAAQRVNVPRRTIIPPPPTGRIMDAFTAEDTEDIMLSAVVPEPVEVPPAVPVSEEPVAPDPAPIVEDAQRVIAQPIASSPLASASHTPPVAEEPAKPKKAKKPRAPLKKSFLARESKVFSLVMLLGALLLTVILIIGIVTARAEAQKDTALVPDSRTVVLSLEAPYAP